MFAFLLFIICFGFIVWMLVFTIKNQNKKVQKYYDAFCQKYSLKLTRMGGTKLYKHPEVGGTYQNRGMNIISYVAYRRRPSTIIEIGINNAIKFDFVIFSGKENRFYLTHSQNDRVKTNDPELDKQFYIYSKVKPEQGFRITAYLINGLKKWPTDVPLRLYINGNVLSTVIDKVVVNEKVAQTVEKAVEAMYQLAPALEQS